MVKFIYSEKATKFCEISTLLLSYVVPVKSKVEISQNFVAFSEYMNFKKTRKNNRKISYLSVTFAQHSQIHSAKQQQQINFGNTLICILFFRLHSHAGSCGQPHFFDLFERFFFFALRYGFDFE